MITSLRGMQDLFGARARLYERVVAAATRVAKGYGYEFCELPKLEAAGLFRRSVGESSDIVGKEMYEFCDKSDNAVCLRPEGTAGAVRAFVQARFDRAGGVRRWFYAGSMFRYERPQKGRLREFHQFGVECFGEGSVFEDAAVIIMAQDVLRELGVTARLHLNSLGTAASMARYKAALGEFLSGVADELCEDCLRRRATNALRVLDCKNERCAHATANAPRVRDFLSADEAAEFAQLQGLLAAAGVEFELDDRLVRGLDYYCKSAFEFVSDELGAKATVIGGGRYDGLVGQLGGRETAAVGWAMGIERICEIVAARESAGGAGGADVSNSNLAGGTGKNTAGAGADAGIGGAGAGAGGAGENAVRAGVFVCAMSGEFLDEAFALAGQIRAALQTFARNPLAFMLENAAADGANSNLTSAAGKIGAANSNLPSVATFAGALTLPLLAQNFERITDAANLQVAMHYEAKSLAKLFAAADKMGARWLVCLSPDEARAGAVMVRDMARKTTRAVAKTALAGYLCAALAGAGD